ncbi:glycoside hydrolase family 3 protein [Phytoactinopolyspora endophytica]|uniref:glycoside hydrolase family 3 protein n=1 Tax=Phytoactinopolyspora endophytica TaxID=1642495 RepID=UPI00197C7FFA|nr:glycoside hydrolase family 3 protein [Phytoactinopolyspora endophytica]
MRVAVAAVMMSVLAAACASDDSSSVASSPSTTPAAESPSATPEPSGTPSGEADETPTPTDQETLPWGPTEEEYAEAESIVADMSLSEKAGQVIMAGYQGLEPPTDLIAELNLGGVIVMGDNVGSLEQLRQAAAEVQDADSRAYPVMVGVDQEGGTVARVREPATEFPTYMTLGAARDSELTTDVARASGDELRALGFTMTFAPVADVTSGPDDPTIGSRAASSDPGLVAETVAASLDGYADAGIIAVPKHFPGHGSVPADSHEELPVQERTLGELRELDFVPFEAAVDAGAPAVMVGHIDVQDVDPGVPSSLSGDVIDLLRADLAFDGLVVTDAQDMAAITETYGAGEAAVRALEAGSDLVLMPADVAAAHTAIVDAVDEGRLTAERLDEAATRGVAVMLHQQAAGDGPDEDSVGSHDELSYRASLEAVTIATGACSGPYVGDSIQITGGDEQDRARLTEAAEEAGLSVGSGEAVRLLGGASGGSGDVVVSLDTPYVLGESDASTKVALYGRTPAAFRALVDVLLGEVTAHGRLPTDVDGVDQLGCPSPPQSTSSP